MAKISTKWKKFAKRLHIVGLSLTLGVPLWGCWVEWSSQRGLAEIRRQMRQEGLPLTPADLRRPMPSADRNAAPVYEQLTQLLKAKPLRGDGEVLNEVKRDVPSTSDNMQQVRAALAQRQDVITLLHQAAQKPECNFNRDYGQGYNLLFPEYAPMRSGLRVLTNESALLLYDGKTLDAIRNETLGFQMAQHTNMDSFMIGKLVGVALNAITLRFMEHVLYTAGDQPGIAAAVEKAIENNWKTVNMADGIRGEVVVGEVTFAQIANGTLRDDEKPGKESTPVPQRPPTFVGKAFVDANELYWLKFLRSVIAVSALPPRESHAKMDALEQEFSRFERLPTRSLAAIMFSVYSQALTKQTQGEAQKAVVSSAAAIMVYRHKHGAFPAELAQAMPTVPADPFDGQPLRYRCGIVEGFVVYSVGPTGKFDGGTANKRPDSHESIFRFPMPAYYTQAPPAAVSMPAPTP